MGFADQLKGALGQAKDKATEYARTHNEQLGAGVDKVGELADKATKGKYRDQISTGLGKTKGAIDKFGDQPDASGAAGPAQRGSAGPAQGGGAGPTPGGGEGKGAGGSA